MFPPVLRPSEVEAVVDDVCGTHDQGEEYGIPHVPHSVEQACTHGHEYGPDLLGGTRYRTEPHQAERPGHGDTGPDVVAYGEDDYRDYGRYKGQRYDESLRVFVAVGVEGGYEETHEEPAYDEEQELRRRELVDVRTVEDVVEYGVHPIDPGISVRRVSGPLDV